MPTKANRIPMWQQALDLHKASSSEYGEIIKDGDFYPQLIALIHKRRRSCAVDLTRVPSSLMTTNSGPAIAPLTLRQAQIRLAELKLYSGAIDGQLGAATVTAIKTFQKVRGIPETGALDSTTERALRGNP